MSLSEARKHEIKIKANEFRGRCAIRKYKIIDLFNECKNYGFKVIRYPLGEDADLGFVLKRDGDTIIFTNTDARLSREIFTLAHEIGHAILHMGTAGSFVDDNFTLSGSDGDDREQEANYFAASLLMPESEMNRFLDLELEYSPKRDLTAMDIARIMSGFDVSFDAVLNRLENLGFISAGMRIRLDSEKYQNRVGRLLRSVGGSIRLNQAGKEIDIPPEYMEYAIYNYNHNAIPEETLRRVLAYYEILMDDVGDRLIEHTEEDDDLEDLIGGLMD